ncbi:hypothetical protein GOP47_0011249 [Adiantum capillus-veneris]|uniref:Uncharacterized protein n=1 Tax=Adiantum capillus-veneris TaxID=13818 RepID=A0A9D4USK6_ADICA|nr:hypothetical protein GOP47_0011249 [Adiantum capillus-veneris]
MYEISILRTDKDTWHVHAVQQRACVLPQQIQAVHHRQLNQEGALTAQAQERLCVQLVYALGWLWRTKAIHGLTLSIELWDMATWKV